MTATPGEFTARRENRRTRPKGYASWRPQHATVRLLDQVAEILSEYDEYLPLTVRQIFYRLVGAFGYEKTERAYARLAEHLVRARRARLVPFEAIRDDGVVIYSQECYASVQGFWDETGARIREYRRDRQLGQPHRVELWCEAAGMAPQLNLGAENYSVPVYSTGGFASLTAVRTIVTRAKEQTVPTVLLHVGDYDPSGESIFQSIAADAAAFLEQDRTLALQRIIPVRVALTEEQVTWFGLPTAPPKLSDSRSRGWRGETCQLEALQPDLLAALVDTAIARWFDQKRLQEQLTLEELDQVELWRGLPAPSEGEH